MNITSTQQQVAGSFKICAAKYCSRPGIHEMQILFLGRTGWFCEECKNSLMCDGLLLEQQVDSIQID